LTFASLHTHSQYSILDASISVDLIAKRAAEIGISSVALTDHGNLFGAVEFYKSCLKYGIKPLIGCELNVAPVNRLEKRRVPGERNAHSLVVIAKNQCGYRNLCRLSSLGYLEGFYYSPRVDKELLEKYSEGLICLSSSISGLVPQLILKDDQEALDKEIQWGKELFGEDYYFELQRHEMSQDHLIEDEMEKESWLLASYQDYISQQNQINKALCDLGKKWNIKVVATNDAHYLERKDWQAHEVLMNVQSGEPREIWEKDSLGRQQRRILNPKRKVYPSHELYLKSAKDMSKLFVDLPHAIENTLEVAEKCDLAIDFDTKHYPVYYPPGTTPSSCTSKEQKQIAEDFLRKLCREGIKKRYNEEALSHVSKVYPEKDPLEVVQKRLDYELEIIISKELSDYLLIVYDFIDWAKNHDIPVGPGRGSGAGSIILYLIGITDIEPLRFSLFFERFINPERVSYPDIDVDICMESRGRVIEYTVQKYGKDNVAQIITFGTMKAKMAVKDVGRVLSVPLTKVNQIAKLIPEDLNMTLEKALVVDPDLYNLYQEDEETKRVIDLAKDLEGSIRNTGIHAAGVIICGESLTDYIPVCMSKDAEMAVSQFSMKPVESVGMLKVDFLGLKTLTSIKTCAAFVKENYSIFVDWVNLPLDDKKAFELLNQGKTLGVFQLESAGMQDLARQLHLDNFEEIIAVVSLYRPGPMDMIPSFIQRKHGKEPIEYEHPWLKDILEETYGIMVYQEQVMQIAQKLANYTLAEGDVLRRAMGKKNMDEMAQEREKFRQGSIKNGIDETVATSIFDKMEKFASYGFNKSHAAAYALLSYITAYFKANYPKEWMASLMTCDRDDISKVAKFITECQSMKIDILPPDVNEAHGYFKATDEGIRFAMSGVKSVGSGVVEAIIEERNKKGRFSSLFDFIQRIDTKKVGKKVIETLVLAGAFDFTKWSRDALLQSVEPMYDVASKEQKDHASGYLTFFSLMDDEKEDQRFTDPPEVRIPLSKMDLLAKEKELLGFYLTGHPLDGFRHLFSKLSCASLAQIVAQKENRIFRTIFIIDSVKVRISMKSQRKFAILTVSDGMEKFEIPVWPELFESSNHLLEDNRLIYAILQQEIVNGEGKLTCRWLEDLAVIDEGKIEACDRAYDKIKMQAERFSMNRKAAKPKVKEVSVSSNQDKITKLTKLCIDVDQAHLTHLLKIKKLVSSNAGSNPYVLNFLKSEQTMGQVFVEGAWGLNWSKELEQEFKKIECISNVEYTE
jgi:DNA polymerase III subunit alpha